MAGKDSRVSSEKQPRILTRRSFLGAAASGIGAIAVGCVQPAAPAPSSGTQPTIPAQVAPTTVVQPTIPAQVAQAPAEATAAETLVCAAPNTAPGIDHEFHISLEGHWARGLVEDKLLKYGTKESEPGSGFLVEDFNKIEPYLAEDYEISPDGRTITFRLHKGITTHAGNEFTADDVLWKFERGYALKAQSLSYFDSMLHVSGGLDGIKKLDKYTFSVTLEEPHPLIARIWINNDIGWFDATEAKKHITDKDPWAAEWLASHAASTGPYKVAEWSPGNQIVFEAHDQYYGDKPTLKKIIQKEVPQSSSRVALVQQGAVDVAERLLPRERNALKSAKGVKLVGVKGSNMDLHIGFNLAKEPFNNKLVRQALNYAMNQQEVIDSILLGEGVPQVSLVSRMYPGFSGEGFPYQYDPEKAMALLKQAGFDSGFKSELYYETENALTEQLAILAKTRFKEVGVDIQLVKVPPATFWDRIWKSEFTMIAAEFWAIVPDPGYCLQLYTKSTSFINWMKYNNPEVDAAIDKSFTFKDALAPERIDLLNQTQRIVVDDAVRVFGVEKSWALAVNSSVSGSNWNTAGIYRPQLMSKA